METKIISTKKVKGNIDFNGHLVFAENLGDVKVEGYVKATGSIGVKTGTYLSAGDGISAGYGISAELEIKTGLTWRIFSGIRLNSEDAKKYGKIIASKKPKNIACGVFEKYKG